jgi:peptidoglycan/LPS O-acetylase OafA/YrhL
VVRTSGYRPDIDGMRAIAILLVLFYHAGFEFVSGGFIGVDIFFVISGYLITGIVVRELAAGSFSFGRFYTRRIKRLLPAFYSVAIVSSVVSYFVLLPYELGRFAESLLSSLFFVSNFYFGSITEGYFAPEVDLLPLLHTWSLAVEEQFYFLWPVSLLVLRRRLSPHQMRILMGVLMAASFVAAEVGVRALSDSVYYAPWSRAGELLMGALLALQHLGKEPTTARDPRPSTLWRWREAGVTAIGFALIAAPAILLDDLSAFPGINSLWPCLGITILIHVGRDSGGLARRLLGLRPLVFVGLISYALYLWHWPVFVFARSLRLDDGPATTWALIGACFVLATISWRFVERPIRELQSVTFRDALQRIFALPAIVLAALSLTVLANDGLENRFQSQPDVLDALRITRAGPDEARGICFKLDEVELPPEADCLLGARTDEAPGAGRGPDALLWGDSIANHYAGFFDEVGRASGIQLRDVTMGGCPPLLGSVRLKRKKGPLCRRRNDAVIEMIQDSDFDTVFLGGYWTFYLEPDGFLGDDVDMSAGRENAARVLRESLDRTLSAILRANKQPVLLRNVPEMDFDAATCSIKNAIHPIPLRRDCAMDAERHRQQTHAVDEMLRDLQSAHPTLQVLSPIDIVCPEESCEADLDGVPLYKAGKASHLNMEGSRVLGRAYVLRHGPLVTGDAPRRDR